MHIDRAEMLPLTMEVGSSRPKPRRWSQMVVAICSVGGCVLSSPPAYDTPDMDPSHHSRSRRSMSTLSARPSDVGVRRDTNIMDAVGPSTPHSNVRETPECSIQATPTPMCTQPEFDSVDAANTSVEWYSRCRIPAFGIYVIHRASTEPLGSQTDDTGHSQWQPQADEADGSQWYPQSCVDQAPSQYILQTSGPAPDNPTEWYVQHHHTGSEYTFMRWQGPSHAAGQRVRQPPDNFTPEDFTHRQCGQHDHN
jgi:hypothetical protein